MKKTLVLISIIIVVIFLVILAGNIAINSFRTSLMGEPVILQEVISPDNKYVAYVFEANGGATTRFTYRLSILKNGSKLKSGDIGNTYITYNDFNVEWIDDNTLMVENIASADVFKQETKIYDVDVKYNYIKD